MGDDDGKSPPGARVERSKAKEDERNIECAGPTVIEVIGGLQEHAQENGKCRGASKFEDFSHEVSANDEFLENGSKQKKGNSREAGVAKDFSRGSRRDWGMAQGE